MRRAWVLAAVGIMVAAALSVTSGSSGAGADVPPTTVPCGDPVPTTSLCSTTTAPPTTAPPTTASTSTTRPPSTTSTTRAPATTTTTASDNQTTTTVAQSTTSTTTASAGAVHQNDDPSSSNKGGAQPAPAPVPVQPPPPTPVQVNPIDLSAPLVTLPSFTPPPTTGTRSTKDVLDALAGLHLDATLLAQVLAPFPVAGLASYTPAAAAPASPAGTTTTVPGTTTTTAAAAPTTVDIAADKGTPVIASAPGVVHIDGADPAGGAVVLTAVDGSQYRYAHLDHVAAQLVEGRHVSQGDVLGGVGGAGDAADPARLVFGIQPAGAAPADPVPYLDRWLAQALASAQTLAAGTGKHTGGSGSAAPIYARGPVTVKTGPLATSTPFDAALSGLVVVSAAGLWWWNRRRRARAGRSGDSDLDPEAQPTST